MCFLVNGHPYAEYWYQWLEDMSILDSSMTILFFYVVRYIPSAKECPLLLKLPDGEISKTNGFISPVRYHAFIIFILVMKFYKVTNFE
jgi:phosphatidylinositol glycan class S